MKRKFMTRWFSDDGNFDLGAVLNLERSPVCLSILGNKSPVCLSILGNKLLLKNNFSLRKSSLKSVDY